MKVKRIKQPKVVAKELGVHILTIATAVINLPDNAGQNILLFGNGDDGKVYQWNGKDHQWQNT